jgi:hypothetical protein
LCGDDDRQLYAGCVGQSDRGVFVHQEGPLQVQEQEQEPLQERKHAVAEPLRLEIDVANGVG